MGCAFEAAKQRNQCGINNSNSSNSNQPIIRAKTTTTAQTIKTACSQEDNIISKYNHSKDINHIKDNNQQNSKRAQNTPTTTTAAAATKSAKDSDKVEEEVAAAAAHAQEALHVEKERENHLNQVEKRQDYVGKDIGGNNNNSSRSSSSTSSKSSFCGTSNNSKSNNNTSLLSSNSNNCNINRKYLTEKTSNKSELIDTQDLHISYRNSSCCRSNKDDDENINNNNIATFNYSSTAGAPNENANSNSNTTNQYTTTTPTSTANSQTSNNGRSNSCCRRRQTLHRNTPPPPTPASPPPEHDDEQPTAQRGRLQRLRCHDDDDNNKNKNSNNNNNSSSSTASKMAVTASNRLQALLWQARNTLASHLDSVVSNSCQQRKQKQQQQQQSDDDSLSSSSTTPTLLKQYRSSKQQHRQQRRRRHTKQQQQHCHHQQQQQQHVADSHASSATSSSSPSSNTSSTTSSTSYNCNASASAAAYNFIGHNYYHLLRNSISFYAASSVILVLCYLTTTTSAAAANSDAAPLDKHPIQGIDWSKFDESSSDKEILDLLLEKKRYDKRLLPPVNDEDFCCGLSSPDMAKNQNARRPHNRGTLTVNVNVLLLSLASPDESSLKYEVEFLLNQQWADPRLQYGNKSHYDFLNALHHHDSIWTPDTYFIMHGDFKDPIIPMHFALRIYRNGTITYAMRRHLILSCQGSLHIFPFDDPKCSFSMESISYEEAQIKYVWKNDEATLRKSPSLTTLNAYLIKNQTTPCDQNSWRGNYSCLRVDLIFTRDRAFYFTTVFIPGIILVTSSFITFWLEWNAVPARSMIGNYSCLQVELTFTRDRAYYFTTVFIPGIILVTSSFITFWLEWNAVPARVMIGVTTMLNFFTTSNGFRSTLPVVSNLTAMNVWDGVCMCFIYASLLEFVCVNYVGRKRPLHNVVYRPGENPVTQRLPAVLSRIGVILASPLEIIEREFHAALSSEKAAAGLSSTGASTFVTTPTAGATPTGAPTSRMRWDQQHGGIIGAAVQNLRERSVRRRTTPTTAPPTQNPQTQTAIEAIYTEPTNVTVPKIITPTNTNTTAVTVEADVLDSAAGPAAQLRRSRSMSTNTPPLILRAAESTRVDVHQVAASGAAEAVTASLDANIQQKLSDIEMAERQTLPLKPPRKKTSRSTSPAAIYEVVEECFNGGGGVGGDQQRAETVTNGEKRRDAGAPNEIVACTTCGGGSNSPCTHSANNGCATETCFVQVRKKEPPHPIRVAKTIDVIARITFPTAYAIFLIFFFVHYKGFS